jgi:hypothetical protein
MSGLTAANPTAKLTIFSQCPVFPSLKSSENPSKESQLNKTKTS